VARLLGCRSIGRRKGEVCLAPTGDAGCISPHPIILLPQEKDFCRFVRRGNGWQASSIGAGDGVEFKHCMGIGRCETMVGAGVGS
jgi:hypothetical protein